MQGNLGDMNDLTCELPPEMSIILVEDEPSHARLMEINLRHAGVENEIVKLEDGLQALEYLMGSGEFEGSKPPESLVVLLDLNLPRMTGHELLERVRKDEGIGQIPVIIVTSSDDPDEMDRCYQLGCNDYLVKPPVGVSFLESFHKVGLC